MSFSFFGNEIELYGRRWGHGRYEITIDDGPIETLLDDQSTYGIRGSLLWAKQGLEVSTHRITVLGVEPAVAPVHLDYFRALTGSFSSVGSQLVESSSGVSSSESALPTSNQEARTISARAVLTILIPIIGGISILILMMGILGWFLRRRRHQRRLRNNAALMVSANSRRFEGPPKIHIIIPATENNATENNGHDLPQSDFSHANTSMVSPIYDLEDAPSPLHLFFSNMNMRPPVDSAYSVGHGSARASTVEAVPRISRASGS